MKSLSPQATTAKLANGVTQGIWVGFTKGHPVGNYHLLNMKAIKISPTKDVNFLQRPFGEWNKVEKLTVAPMSYEGLDEEEVEVDLGNDKNTNNNYNLVGDLDRKDDDENFLRIKLKKKRK